MAIKEEIQKRAKEAALAFKEKFINEQKEKVEKIIGEYEKLLTEYYQLEVKLSFYKAMEYQNPEKERKKETEELMQQQILLLKKVKDIENSGALEEYDAVMQAIKELSENLE